MNIGEILQAPPVSAFIRYCHCCLSLLQNQPTHCNVQNWPKSSSWNFQARNKNLHCHILIPFQKYFKAYHEKKLQAKLESLIICQAQDQAKMGIKMGFERENEHQLHINDSTHKTVDEIWSLCQISCSQDIKKHIGWMVCPSIAPSECGTGKRNQSNPSDAKSSNQLLPRAIKPWETHHSATTKYW